MTTAFRQSWHLPLPIFSLITASRTGFYRSRLLRIRSTSFCQANNMPINCGWIFRSVRSATSTDFMTYKVQGTTTLPSEWFGRYRFDPGTRTRSPSTSERRESLADSILHSSQCGRFPPFHHHFDYFRSPSFSSVYHMQPLPVSVLQP